VHYPVLHLQIADGCQDIGPMVIIMQLIAFAGVETMHVVVGDTDIVFAGRHTDI
jgi:hypothetical protein